MNSRQESERYGLAQRKRLPRSALGELAERRFDPINVLRRSCAGHLPSLLPLKFERMSESPFAFFRGSVEIMAADLGAKPRTAIEVQLCGDAHLKNFGFFSTPGAEIVLDINDFDQTTRGPWEWDIKRMAVSIVLAGQVAGDSKSQYKIAVRKFLDDYVAWIRRFASMPTLDVARHRALRDYRDPLIRLALDRAERSTPLSNLKRFAHKTKSGYRLRCEPGLIWEVRTAEREAVLAALPRYRSTLAADHQLLFDRFQPVDVGFKVVGTGSVGTRDYVVLFLGYNNKDPLFLQIKEEPPSAYVPYYKDRSAPRHQGERVVRGQHAMQVLSDPLLGWCSIEKRDYLVRQLSDHKSSIEPEQLKGGRLVAYSRVCAELLAKAHARSGNPTALSAYLGASGKAERALLEFALNYAEQVERDFAAFRKALKRDLAQQAKHAASQPA